MDDRIDVIFVKTTSNRHRNESPFLSGIHVLLVPLPAVRRLELWYPRQARQTEIVERTVLVTRPEYGRPTRDFTRSRYTLRS